ncbi:hypothetical protein SB778_03555 [Paraburkholderia sp. SIMBA_050]
MTYTTMPFCDLLDSSKFQPEKENPALASKMDGGYVVTRPRHTRRPRRTFTLGFTDFSDAQRAAVDQHFDDMHGGSSIFYFVHPVSKETILARYTTDTTLQWTYSGSGHTPLWSVTFKVQEA